MFDRGIIRDLSQSPLSDRVLEIDDVRPLLGVQVSGPDASSEHLFDHFVGRSRLAGPALTLTLAVRLSLRPRKRSHVDVQPGIRVVVDGNAPAPVVSPALGSALPGWRAELLGVWHEEMT